LSSQLKIPVVLGRPWKNLQSRKSIPIPENKSLAYATAIGLAIRAADNPFWLRHII